MLKLTSFPIHLIQVLLMWYGHGICMWVISILVDIANFLAPKDELEHCHKPLIMWVVLTKIDNIHDEISSPHRPCLVL